MKTGGGISIAGKVGTWHSLFFQFFFDWSILDGQFNFVARLKALLVSCFWGHRSLGLIRSFLAGVCV